MQTIPRKTQVIAARHSYPAPWLANIHTESNTLPLRSDVVAVGSRPSYPPPQTTENRKMQTTHISNILITADRQRKEFDAEAMESLRETIDRKGLLHAIVVRETPEGLVLVAGERRFRCVKDLWMLSGKLRYNNQAVPEDHVPYVTLGQLTPLEAEEAELEENLQRKDLTWPPKGPKQPTRQVARKRSPQSVHLKVRPWLGQWALKIAMVKGFLPGTRFSRSLISILPEAGPTPLSPPRWGR